MLSALQLHRKTIKFQKPDTTQGGITFKARYCLLFSVLNKILRVGASGWFIMNRDSVHMIYSSSLSATVRAPSKFQTHSASNAPEKMAAFAGESASVRSASFCSF